MDSQIDPASARKRITGILRRPLLCAVFSGLLLALAFPSHPHHPLAFLYGNWWAWIALVPLLIAVAATNTLARGFWLGAAAGFVFYLLSLYWIGNTQGGGAAVVAGAALGAAWLSLFTGAFAAAQVLVLRPFGRIGLLAAPVLWTAMEYLQSMGELGFPWLLLAHSQSAMPVLLQLATFAGAYGVSFAIVSTSAVLAMALQRDTDTRRWVVASLAVPTCVAAYGLAIMEPERTDGVRVALVQNNMGLEKWRAGGLERSFASLSALSHQAADDNPDLLVWPETAIPCNLSWRQDCKTRLLSLSKTLNTPILTGAPDTDAETREPYNSAFLFQPEKGPDSPLLSYAKMHLVPFGERTPWRDSLPLLGGIDWSVLTGDLGPAEFLPGTQRTLFPVATGTDTSRFALLICFESVFPDLVRQSVDVGADFLVIITNDSWFGATAGPFQHAGIAALRAVENRTGIARCATNGVTLFIDRFGRSRMQTEFGTAAVRISTIAPRQSATFYTRFGDLFAGATLTLSILLLLAAPPWATRQRRRT